MTSNLSSLLTNLILRPFRTVCSVSELKMVDINIKYRLIRNQDDKKQYRMKGQMVILKSMVLKLSFFRAQARPGLLHLVNCHFYRWHRGLIHLQFP